MGSSTSMAPIPEEKCWAGDEALDHDHGAGLLSLFLKTEVVQVTWHLTGCVNDIARRMPIPGHHRSPSAATALENFAVVPQ